MRKKSLALAGLVIVATISFKALSFFRAEADFLPPLDEIKEIHIAYSFEGDETFEETGLAKEFYLTGEQKIKPILELLEDKKFPKFPLLNSDNLDFNESWFINVFPKNSEPFYIYVDKYNISEYRIKDSRLYEHLRKNYT